MKVQTTITSGTLTPGTRVEGESVGYTSAGRVSFRSTWAGTFDRVALDVHDGEEDYAYFVDGHINGISQSVHGFPVAELAR